MSRALRDRLKHSGPGLSTLASVPVLAAEAEGMGAFYLCGCRRDLCRLSIAAHTILWLPPLGGSIISAQFHAGSLYARLS
jgi:hypothetical protein